MGPARGTVIVAATPLGKLVAMVKLADSPYARRSRSRTLARPMPVPPPVSENPRPSSATVMATRSPSARAMKDVQPVFMWAALPAGLAVVLLLFVRETGKGRKTTASDKGSTGGTGAWGGKKARPTWAQAWRAVPAELKRYLLIVFLFNVGNCSNQFLLLRAESRGFSATDVIAAYALYNLTYTLLAYPAGAIADRLGHKRVLMAGYLVHGLTYAGFAAAGLAGPWVIWVLFGVYGAHMALTEGVEKALIVDLAPAELRATTLGMFSTVVGVALLPASAIAGVMWDRLGPVAPFAVGGALGVGAAVALGWGLKRRPQ